MGTDPNQEWKDRLFRTRKNAWDTIPSEEIQAAMAYCEGYKHFLNVGKTERLCVQQAIAMAQAADYEPYQWGKGDVTSVANNDSINRHGSVSLQQWADGVPVGKGVH